MIYQCICGKEFDSLNAYKGHKANCQQQKELKREKLQKEKDEEKTYEYLCECGRRFKTQRSRNSHARFCSEYVSKSSKKDENGNHIITSPYYQQDTWKCECGKEFDNGHALSAHFRHCDVHREVVGIVGDKHYQPKGQMSGWENKTEEELKEIREKSNQTLKERYLSKELIPVFKGRKHSSESKQKIRESTIKYLKSSKEEDFAARFSLKGCDYIDQLNTEKGWHLQHAKNGGEIHKLGYFADGYDEANNIWFEYDEPRHYIDIKNNILTYKDLERQNYIIDHLSCQFWRYNERTDTLYQVN